MKRSAALVMILALVIGYGVTALAQRGPPDRCPDPTHDCWYETICIGTGCILYKCCTDCVWQFKKGECVETCVTNCVPLT